MPVQYGKDQEGCYARWGNEGHNYYYKCNSDIARKNAGEKALAQGIAIGDFGPIKYIGLKKWRNTADSSNVNRIMYNDETLELVIRFKSGDVYTYEGVSFDIFNNVVNGNAACKTSGDSWDIGKDPSVGAAVHKYLVDSSIVYRKGGSLR